MDQDRRHVLLVQLPIPPPGPGPIKGNVPLAAGYLKLLARRRGLEDDYEIEIFPSRLANELGDQALVTEIVAREPWLVGFTCYLWNIERTLWLAEQIKRLRPQTLVMLGGPEITADNAWVLESPAVDFAAVGEGEQTFCELLEELRGTARPGRAVDGLFVRGDAALPAFRRPLPDLNEISSPYLAGILDAADEEMLLLETIRGCIFKCKFCYYPKSYDALYFLSQERLVANLRHARERGAKEVVLLDPTLNQRKDFPGFLRLLANENPGGQFTYFGELRAEGINAEIAGLLRAANFTEVEIGLQSIDPLAQELMDRKNNMRAFERGTAALLDAGIKVKIDLIVGLPGDTVDSVRRGMNYLRESGLYTSVQVFNLAVLPGTAFRQEAETLGLKFQPRPPYYVTETPTLDLATMLELVEESQEIFGVEFDPLPEPTLEFAPERPGEPVRCLRIDFDDRRESLDADLPFDCLAQAVTLWLTSRDLHAHRQEAASLVAKLLAANPFTTLQIVLEPTGDPRRVTPVLLEHLSRACFTRPTYLDKFYAVLPGRTKGAKRLIVTLPPAQRCELGPQWIEAVHQWASIAWQGDGAFVELDEDEHLTAVGRSGFPA